MKAIDTRTKEIKLARERRAALEETSELVLADSKDKKKDKRLTNDRNKRRNEKEKLKEPREKRKISKKKPKDETSEFQEVEDKFFEIVQRVITK